jgi:Muconolactone delta-isomerase
MRYMVAFTWREFPDVSKAEAERRSVQTLIQDGKMEQMFLAQDRSRGWFIMLAESETQAKAALMTLPFAAVMKLETTEVLPTYP